MSSRLSVRSVRRAAAGLLVAACVALSVTGCRATYSNENGPRGPERVELAPEFPQLFGGPCSSSSGACVPEAPAPETGGR